MRNLTTYPALPITWRSVLIHSKNQPWPPVAGLEASLFQGTCAKRYSARCSKVFLVGVAVDIAYPFAGQGSSGQQNHGRAPPSPAADARPSERGDRVALGQVRLVRPAIPGSEFGVAGKPRSVLRCGRGRKLPSPCWTYQLAPRSLRPTRSA